MRTKRIIAATMAATLAMSAPTLTACARTETTKAEATETTETDGVFPKGDGTRKVFGDPDAKPRPKEEPTKTENQSVTTQTTPSMTPSPEPAGEPAAPATEKPKAMPAPGQVVDQATIDANGGVSAAFSVSEIPDDVFARMRGKSFGDDCTIPRADLRYLRALHVDMEGNTRVGEMVVAASVADDVIDIFHQLYDAKRPIRKMVLVDEYDASDEASCADGNTSAFNFRPVSGGTELSMHAYGLAIDVNTFENPYCIPERDYVFPPEAARFADRSLQEPGMIHEGDLCWRLFTERGWTWGGSWSTPIDYQHFEYRAGL